MSPPPAGCPKGKIQILHLEGGIPRGGGRRRRQSTAAWLSRPTEIFSSVSPFAGPTENFTSAPPLSRGEACGSLPLAGTFGSPSTCAGQPGQFHCCQYEPYWQSQSIETRGIPMLSLLAELSDNALIGGIHPTRKTCLRWSLVLQWLHWPRGQC